MTDTSPQPTEIIGGVDTHQDLHTAAIVSLDGAVLGTESFSTTRAGYRAMLRWFQSHGELLRVGVESTGTYGAGITRHLALAGVPVLEVTGPDPATRRAKGKDDALDAISAGRGRSNETPGSGGQGPFRRRGGLAGAAHDAKNRGEVSSGDAAAASQHDCRRAGGGARPSPQPDPHAAPTHLRGLAAGHGGLPRPGGRDQARLEVPCPQDLQPQRRDRRTRSIHRPTGRGTRAQSAPARGRGHRDRRRIGRGRPQRQAGGRTTYTGRRRAARGGAACFAPGRCGGVQPDLARHKAPRRPWRPRTGPARTRAVCPRRARTGAVRARAVPGRTSDRAPARGARQCADGSAHAHRRAPSAGPCTSGRPAARRFAVRARSAVLLFSLQGAHRLRSGSGAALPHFRHSPRARRSAVLLRNRSRPRARPMRGSL